MQRLSQTFAHVTMGSGHAHLRQVRKDGVNVAIATDVVSPGTLRYLAGIDFHNHFKSDWDAEPAAVRGCMKTCSACTLFRSDEARPVIISPAVFEDTDPRRPEAVEIVRHGLRRFPQSPELQHFADDVLQALRAFADATDAPRVASHIMAKYPVPAAAWHRDNATNFRGLITFMGPGTFWRPNDTVPDADWLQDEKDPNGMPENNFGRFGRTFMASARQMETATMAVWRGDRHARPFIHAEPTSDVVGRQTMRLTMHMDMLS